MYKNNLNNINQRFGWVFLLFLQCVNRLLVLSIVLFFCTQFSFTNGHDLELWTWEKLRIDLSYIGIPGENSLYFENVNRFNDDITEMFMDHQMAGVHFDLPWWEGWSVMPSFRYIDERSIAIEYRYLIDFFYEMNELFDSKWDVKFRFRFETRDIQDRDDITYRYRQSVSLSYPLPLTIQERPIKTYIINEVNLDFRSNKFNRYRFETGFKFPFTSSMSWTLGYQLETNRIHSGSWDADSMIMTGFDFKF